MAMTPIYQKCPKCKDDGIAQTQKGPEDSCQMCSGEGQIAISSIDLSAITSKLDTIETKIDDIKSVVDDIWDEIEDD